MLRTTEINDVNQFLELRYKWNNVLDRCRDKHIYLTWEYLSTYWKHFGKEKKLRILCIKDKNKIIAIAPLRQSRLGFSGPLSYDVIEPLGYRGLMPEGADYTGFILAEREAECLQLFLDYLVKHDSWDFIYLMDIPGNSAIPGLLSQISNLIPLAFETEKGASCPYMLIPNSVDALMKTLSHNFRYNLRRSMRKLQSDFHKVEFKKYDEVGSVEETMRSFFELHQKRCKSKGLPGVFAKREICNFYIDFAKLFADNDWLALYFLLVDDKPIAAHYCFEYKNKIYFALGGFDPYYSSYSVGNLVHLKTIEKSIEKGLEEYDFLKGDEAYKSGWTANRRRNLRITFVNKKFTSNLYNWGIRTIKKSRINRVLEKSLTYR
jgi:hypothetical protein